MHQERRTLRGGTGADRPPRWAHGVEIAYCPEWRGIWLDRGELDRILENDSDGTRSRDGHDQHDPHARYNDREQAQPKRKSRSSVLTDMFGRRVTTEEDLMSRWEYKIADMTKLEKEVGELNLLGAEGWEAVGMVSTWGAGWRFVHPIVLLKRSLPEAVSA